MSLPPSSPAHCLSAGHLGPCLRTLSSTWSWGLCWPQLGPLVLSGDASGHLPSASSYSRLFWTVWLMWLSCLWLTQACLLSVTMSDPLFPSLCLNLPSLYQLVLACLSHKHHPVLTWIPSALLRILLFLPLTIRREGKRVEESWPELITDVCRDVCWLHGPKSWERVVVISFYR